MSAQLFVEDILFYQRLLKASGYYNGLLDSDWGPLTHRADTDFENDAAALRASLGVFDSRSESHISTMHIEAQKRAREFMAIAISGPHTCKIISGTRSYAEQNELFRKGRWGNPPPRVTNARGGQSNHNFCIAWDIGLFDQNGRYLTGGRSGDEEAYTHISRMVETVGLDWGGDWSSFVDRPHYQVHTGLSTSETRQRFERGQPYV